MRQSPLIFALTLLLASGLPVQAEPVKLSIVEVNDFYQMSETSGRGGFARLAAVVKAERAAGKHVLVVHAGDTLSPSLMSGFDQGAHMVDLFNVLVLDAFVPGNHEFDFGKDSYLKLMASARFPIFAANLRGPDGKVLPGHQDHTVIEVEGVKVGILGVTLDESPIISSPGDLKFGSTYDAVATEAKALRAEGADIVVAIAHSGIENDWRMFNAHLAEIMVLGHSHDLRVEYDGKGAMVESGADGEFVVVTDLALDKQTKDGKTRFSWHPNFRIIDTAGVAPDPDMAAKIKVYEAELSKELDVPLAVLDVPLDTHEAVSRAGETAFGNLVADALRAATNADLGLTNGGGIRGDKEYAAGSQFTRKDVLTELPFGNQTVLVRIRGADLLAALEHGLDKLPAPTGHFPQVSGMTIEVDASKPAGSRVAKANIAGKPLDPAASYTLATNDYLLRGGDGYDMLPRAEVLRDANAGQLMANDVMVFARKQGHVSAKVEGRILIVK